MKILLTGANGFVGKYLAEQLNLLGVEIFALDSSKADIRDAEKISQIVSSFQPDLIYHLAAIAYVPQCEKDFNLAISVNVAGTYNLLRASQHLKKPARFIFISTANVYGKVNPADLPLTEAAPVKPDNNYALSKLMAEELVRKYQRETAAGAVIFRSFNHIGPGQGEAYAIPSFTKQLIKIKRGEQDPLIKVGNLTAERDFTDVRDIVKAYALAATQGEGIYNLCSGHTLSMRAVLDKLIEIVDVQVDVQIDPAVYRPADLPILSGDNTLVSKELGWKPEISLEESLGDIVREKQ